MTEAIRQTKGPSALKIEVKEDNEMEMDHWCLRQSNIEGGRDGGGQFEEHFTVEGSEARLVGFLTITTSYKAENRGNECIPKAPIIIFPKFQISQ